MRAETYRAEYQKLAIWFLEHDRRALKLAFVDDAAFDSAVVSLGEAIDIAIDNWIDEHRLGAASESPTGRRPAPVANTIGRLSNDENLSPSFRAALKDAGRGHLLR